MWTVYKTKAGDTLDRIVSMHRIKDPTTILTHKDNKKIAKDLKAGKELPKGTKVTIPDPKGKVYVVKTKSGVKHMSETEYNEYLKVVHKKMDEAVFKLKQRLTYATGRHDAQQKINDDQWFVAACISLVNSVPEPKSRKKAESSFSKAEKAAKARNYKAFEKEIEPANVAIATYSNEVLSWIDGIINAGEGTVTVLEGVKTVGMVCGAVAATTACGAVSSMSLSVSAELNTSCGRAEPKRRGGHSLSAAAAHTITAAQVQPHYTNRRAEGTRPHNPPLIPTTAT